MRPGYLQGYGEDTTRPGNLGDRDTINVRDAFRYLNTNDTGVPDELEVGYIPEHMKYSKIFPNYPIDRRIPYAAPRDPMTFNVLMT